MVCFITSKSIGIFPFVPNQGKTTSFSLSDLDSGFLQFEDEFSSAISEEEEGIVNFDCAPPPSSPNSYAIIDKSGMSSPITSKTQLRRHVDTFTNRIDDMLSAAREGVSNFPSGTKSGHRRLPTNGSEDGDSGHDERKNKSKHSSDQIEDDSNDDEITVELMTI